MIKAQVAIVGGGLSGLYAAYRLKQLGVTDYILLEGRDIIGGRIAEACYVSENTRNRFDLGPTWFWPEFQHQLDQLIGDLGLKTFVQNEVGDMLVERSLQALPMRMRGYQNGNVSMRLVGGMSALVDALYEQLDEEIILLGKAVESIKHGESGIELTTRANSADDTSYSYLVQHVVLAVPPRLAEETIHFTPKLPDDLTMSWRQTDTWMAPHAKYIAVYDSPFWLENGLSGEARSVRGPLGEIHDASIQNGSGALFGFFGIPAQTRRQFSEETLKLHCREQLVRLFGPMAEQPKMDIIKDWANDKFTTTDMDLHGGNQHGTVPAANAPSGVWMDSLTGIASEWSNSYPGYLAGAIDAASKGVERWSKIMIQPR